MLSPELMPTLHTSSFHADQALREPPGKSADALLLGFREQTAAVAVGINALIERAATEGTGIIIEGAHIVPGFLDLEIARRPDPGGAVHPGGRRRGSPPHRTSRPARTPWARGRPSGTPTGFENIRRLQRYVKSQALSHGVPMLPELQLRPVDRRGDGPGHGTRDRCAPPRSAPPRPRTPRRRDERQRDERGRPHEAVPRYGRHRRDPRDQPMGRAVRASRRTLRWSPRRARTPTSCGRRSWRPSPATSPWRPPSPKPTRCTSKASACRRWRRTPWSRCP